MSESAIWTDSLNSTQVKTGLTLVSQKSEPDSKPLREKLLPQASLRFFLVLIGISALVMVTFRFALVDGVLWAKVVALLFTIVTASFAAYTVLFLLAGLFTASTQPVRSALGYDSNSQDGAGSPGDADPPEGVGVDN